MPDVKIAHGGTCPNGYIFDHNKNSIYYGKCVALGTGKPAAAEKTKKPKITRKLGSYA